MRRERRAGGQRVSTLVDMRLHATHHPQLILAAAMKQQAGINVAYPTPGRRRHPCSVAARPGTATAVVDACSA